MKNLRFWQIINIKIISEEHNFLKSSTWRDVYIYSASQFSAKFASDTIDLYFDFVKFTVAK